MTAETITVRFLGRDVVLTYDDGPNPDDRYLASIDGFTLCVTSSSGEWYAEFAGEARLGREPQSAVNRLELRLKRMAKVLVALLESEGE